MKTKSLIWNTASTTRQELSELSHLVVDNYIYFLEKVTALSESSAEIDLNSTGYSFLRTKAGVLLIRCEGAERYLNGHTIKLQIGNPLNIRFSGFKLQFAFGRKGPQMPSLNSNPAAYSREEISAAERDFEAWKKSLKWSESNYAGDLQPGSWTSVEAILPQTSVEEIAYLEVWIKTDIISLTRR